MKSKRILCVGLVCVDIVQVCESYPKEDTDRRCLEQHWQRGGNASNNCTVLSQLGAESEFFGTISDGLFSGYVTNNFEINNIIIDNCVFHGGCDFPLSIVIINSQNGSRTIIHSNKNLPELKVEDLKKVNLSKYSWIHFEGRNVQQVKEMIAYVRKWNAETSSDIKISVEAEKPRSELNILIPLADFLFVGKDYAHFCGCNSMNETIDKMKSLVRPGAAIIIAWGEEGASGYSEHEGLVYAPSKVPSKVVDTLGAGDTFCAAVMHSLNKGNGLLTSIQFGCNVAGTKVGIKGFAQLGEACSELIKSI